jgi:hypothetical protein
MTFHRYLDESRERSIHIADGMGADTLGRLRVSQPKLLFDSKQLFDNQPLLWDDQQVSGTATTSTFSSLTASTTLQISASVVGERIRTTKARFQYQSGNSILKIWTGNFASQNGVISEYGSFDSNNGFFFRVNSGTAFVVKRSYTSGSVTDTAIAQSEWNIDTLDGSGLNSEKGLLKNPSKLTVDFTKMQVMFCDYQWLGVGRSRLGVNILGKFFAVHEFNHANSVTSAYMQTPNHPIRARLYGDGSNATATMEIVCSAVMVEGSRNEIGVTRSFSNEGAHVDCATGDQLYGLVGIRVKSTHRGATIKPLKVSVISETNDDVQWKLLFNPSINTHTGWVGQTNSSVEIAKGTSTSTVVSEGIEKDGGYITSAKGGAESQDLDSILTLGRNLDDTLDTIWLVARPLGAGTVNADISGLIKIKELV